MYSKDERGDAPRDHSHSPTVSSPWILLRQGTAGAHWPYRPGILPLTLHRQVKKIEARKTF